MMIEFDMKYIYVLFHLLGCTFLYETVLGPKLKLKLKV